MLVTKDLMQTALAHYAAKGAVYLREAEVEFKEAATLVARGSFAIPCSSYTADTGHFNAAEFIICANQLLSVAYVQAAVHANGEAVLNSYKETFAKLLIVEAEQRFRRMIAPANFIGEVVLGEAISKKDHVFIDADIKFGDQSEPAKATGRYRLCLPHELYRLIL